MALSIAMQFICAYFQLFSYTAFHLLNFLAFLKLITSLIKYMPQAFLNYARKSTRGWSATSSVLDAKGSIFSILQTLFIAKQAPNPSAEFIQLSVNAPKVPLAVLSLFFSITFLVQHVTYNWSGIFACGNHTNQMLKSNSGNNLDELIKSS